MKDLNNYSEKDFAKLRIDEQIKGALQLGINREQIFNLNIPDGEFENTIDNIEKIVFHIREFKPDIVITHNPEDAINIFTESAKWVNHRDHRHTGLTVIDACYPYSRDRGFFPKQFSESGLSPHNVNKLLFSDSYQHKDRKYFEITDQVNIKRNALEAHKFGIGEYIDDYIDENKIGDRYFETLRYVEIY